MELRKAMEPLDAMGCTHGNVPQAGYAVTGKVVNVTAPAGGPLHDSQTSGFVISLTTCHSAKTLLLKRARRMMA